MSSVTLSTTLRNEVFITLRLCRGRVIGPVCVCTCLSVTKNFENSRKRAI